MNFSYYVAPKVLKIYHLMEQKEKNLMVGDLNMDNEVSIADINLIINMMLGTGQSACPPIVADCNGDNEVNIADVNTIIQLIYNR